MSQTDFRTSNALGVPIPLWIIKQMEKRSSELKMENQTNSAQITNNLLFRANRTAWVRLVSSIDLKSRTVTANQTTGEIMLKESKKSMDYFKDLVANIDDPTSLAKNYVLYGGVSKYKNLANNKFGYDLRGGFNETYNITGKESEIERFGYRPMPGLTSVKIETQGKLGSVRAASIEFKVWNKQQLDIIDTLYFKLGYTMFLEWGQTHYYDSTNNELKSSEDFSINPFEPGITKEDIYNKISHNIRQSEGNYDAMLGVVTNFNFTYNQEGGYDCTLKLISLGVLISSMKINNPRVLPNLQEYVVRKLYNRLIDLRKQELEKERLLKDQQSADPNNLLYYPPCVRNKTKFVEIATSSNGRLSEKRLSGKNQAYKAEVNGVSYFFYRSEVDANSGEYQTTGYSTRGTWYCDGDQLYIDNKNVDLFYKTYKEILDNSNIAKVYAPYDGPNTLRILNAQLQPNLLLPTSNINKDYVSKISNIDKAYLAFNKFKALIPIDSKKYKVQATIKLPDFSVTRTIVDQNVSQNDFRFNSLNTKSITSVLRSSEKLLEGGALGVVESLSPNNQITYTLLSTPRKISQTDVDNPFFSGSGEATDYVAVLTYNSNVSEEIHEYGLSISYDGETDLGNSGIQKRYSTENPKIQEKIKEVLNNPNELWDITSIDEIERRGFLYNEINIPKINLVLTKKISITFPNKKSVEGTTANERVPILQDIDTVYTFDIRIITNDLGIITSISVPKNKDLQRASDAIDQAAQQTAQNLQQIDQVEEPQLDVPLSEVQKSETEKYKSAIEVMIRILQLYSLDKSIEQGIETDRIVKEIKLLDLNVYKEFTRDLFSIGAFSDILNDSTTGLLYYSANKEQAQTICLNYDARVSKGEKIINENEALLVRSLFGFHFGLMGNKVKATELLSKGYHVNYDELMRTYVIPYAYNSGIIDGTQLNHPVYLPLGFVIMILNNICTIYEDKKPLVYFDYNPNTNICLSTPKHLSTNPYEVLIPFQGSNQDYIDILEPTTLVNSNGSFSIMPLSGSESASPSIYTPQNSSEGDTIAKDRISAGLPKFKFIDTEFDNYRGRTMNVLISCDYLLKILSTYSNSNGSADVYAKEFIEQILFDVNKSLGDVNIFRLAYDDSSNVAHVVDDQFTPNLEEKYPNALENSTDPSNRTRLPLFGIGTIARNLEIRTEVASRLSNMIAISANSNLSSQANLSKSSESFGFYNLGYTDRYIPTRTEIGDESIALPTQTMIRSTIQFNEAIKTFYGSANPAYSAVGHATNYYIQRMSKLKTEDKATRASAMIPVSLNFTVDGMSGFSMGQSFTIDNEYLPYSYNLNRLTEFGVVDRTSTVAFVIVGLDHVIESNQWTSNVRSNMIFAKSAQDFRVEENKRLKNNNFTVSSLSGNINQRSYDIDKISLSDINLSQNWEKIAFDFIAKEESFIPRPKPDEGNLRAGYGTDIIVLSDGTIKKVGSDTVFTKSDADRTLTYQIKNQFSKTIIRQIGEETWNSLKDPQKAALVSFAYNVGSLTSNIRSALKTNLPNLTAVANAIATGPTTGKQSGRQYSALQKRRKKEATLYLS